MIQTVVRGSPFRRTLWLERRIRKFIMDELVDEPFDGDDPLAAEALDSLAIEQLITHLEDEFEIGFDDRELVRSNFASIQVLAGLVQDKRRLAGRLTDA